MAIKKPLVIGSNGEIEQLQAGDIILAGSTTQSFSAINENAGAISQGQVVYVSSSGNVNLANNAAEATAKAIGVVEDASIASTASGSVLTDGAITIADWTTIAGAATLTAGAVYFLDGVDGNITTIPPTLAGSYVVRIGTAISTTTLEVSISRPIKL